MDLFANRAYRRLHGGAGLKYFRVTLGETDLHIGAWRDCRQLALSEAARAREEILRQVAAQREFLTSFTPVTLLSGAGRTALEMAQAAEKADVGPMAAVAGAVAQRVGRAIAAVSPEVIVENGGDIYIRTKISRLVEMDAGHSPLSGKIAIELSPGEWGVATSSATVGHSISLGRADAATVVSRDAALSDAVATGLGNRIKTPQDIKGALEWALTIDGVLGAAGILGEHFGACGDIRLAALDGT